MAVPPRNKQSRDEHVNAQAINEKNGLVVLLVREKMRVRLQ
jgi:hypothetical protein